MLRLAVPADGARLAEIYAPAVSEHATSFELVPPDAAEMARRVTAVTARTPWLVLEESGRSSTSSPAQGFANAYAGITLPNPASVGFHKAMGFEEIGIYREIGYKFGRWHDVIWMHRPLAPRLPEMQSPRGLPVTLALLGIR